jgi:glycosyltransferase involved in cell wall biosynthesis
MARIKDGYLKVDKIVLFFSDFQGLTGGHLKAWHYYNHVKSTPGYTAYLYLSGTSKFDKENPWFNEGKYIISDYWLITPDLLFIDGMEWELIEPEYLQYINVPIINLIQGIQHSKPGNPRYQFLTHRAIRISVSSAVQNAILATKIVNGPTILIENGLNIEELPEVLESAEKDIDLFVVGIKNWYLAKRLRTILPIFKLLFPSIRKLEIEFLMEGTERSTFLHKLSRSKISLLLPFREEGFYLPALEAMHLHSRVVVYDCLGNRDFCRNGENCYLTNYNILSIVYSLYKALHEVKEQCSTMDTRAAETVEQFSIEREQMAFQKILYKAADLWGSHL